MHTVPDKEGCGAECRIAWYSLASLDGHLTEFRTHQQSMKLGPESGSKDVGLLMLFQSQ